MILAMWKSQDITDTLREAIAASGRSLRDIERTTGVDHGRLSRFMRRSRGISADTFAELCTEFGFRLVKRRPREER